MKWFKNLWRKTWFKFVFSFAAVAVIIVGVVLTSVTTGHSIVQTACLAQTLDVNLDKFGLQKNKELFIQQAAMAAQIHRRRVEEGKEFFCPPGNFWGKAELTRRWFLGTSKFWKQSERTVIVDKAAKGEYKFDWPQEYAQANNYKATHLRVRFTPHGIKIGMIGNMTLYKE